jgi:hypothetical protein
MKNEITTRSLRLILLALAFAANYWPYGQVIDADYLVLVFLTAAFVIPPMHQKFFARTEFSALDLMQLLMQILGAVAIFAARDTGAHSDMMLVTILFLFLCLLFVAVSDVVSILIQLRKAFHQRQ